MNYIVLCRPEELRIPFERFGHVRDVYIPKDYYTGLVFLLQKFLVALLHLEFISIFLGVFFIHCICV